jgi:hypothetical protein
LFWSGTNESVTPRIKLVERVSHKFASPFLVECTHKCGYYVQVITVRELSDADGAEDYLFGERGNQKGKVPKAFLELLTY